MRANRRCYSVILIAVLCAFSVLKLYDFRWIDRKYPARSVVTVDPSSKRHWFRLKITEKKDEPRLKNSSKRILLWTKFFGNPNYIPPLEQLNCAIKDCIITTNRSYLSQSDALIFHLRDISLKDMPTFKQPQQRWILLNHEAPPNVPNNILKYLDGLFNWTATYRFDSDIQLTPIYRKHLQPITKLPNIAHTKTRMVAWFVSNCKTNSNRERFVKELRKSIPVDVYGECGFKVCLPKMSDECYRKAASEYRYYLAFENSVCKDYVTEKFYHVLGTDMVPVVLGGANYSKVAPPNSYIDALSFHSPRELAHFLLIVARNAKIYNSYFEWKKSYKFTYEHYACQICRKLHESSPPSWINDLYHWWYTDANCKTWKPNS